MISYPSLRYNMHEQSLRTCRPWNSFAEFSAAPPPFMENHRAHLQNLVLWAAYSNEAGLTCFNLLFPGLFFDRGNLFSSQSPHQLASKQRMGKHSGKTDLKCWLLSLVAVITDSCKWKNLSSVNTIVIVRNSLWSRISYIPPQSWMMNFFLKHIIY